MKKISAILISLFIFGTLTATAQHDISFWNRHGYGEEIQYPWYTYFGPKVTVDYRYNFDQKKTGAVYLGKLVGGKKFSAVPAGGVLFGKYNGVSPQVYFLLNVGRANIFTQHQYVKGLGSNNNFQYHWIDAVVTATNHVSVGVDWQVYHEWQASFAENDIGPTAKYTFKPIKAERKKVTPYIKAWYAKSVGPQNKGGDLFYTAVGISF